jgi:hypothetical protein
VHGALIMFYPRCRTVDPDGVMKKTKRRTVHVQKSVSKLSK